MPIEKPANDGQDKRRRTMELLAKAEDAVLIAAWESLADKPEITRVRGPETGLVMVRARAGGSGDKFNLGEMTVTRCALRLDSGAAGVAYVAGRSHRKAELAALGDALLQHPGTRAGQGRKGLRALTRSRRCP